MPKGIYSSTGTGISRDSTMRTYNTVLVTSTKQLSQDTASYNCKMRFTSNTIRDARVYATAP